MVTNRAIAFKFVMDDKYCLLGATDLALGLSKTPGTPLRSHRFSQDLELTVDRT